MRARVTLQALLTTLTGQVKRIEQTARTAREARPAGEALAPRPAWCVRSASSLAPIVGVMAAVGLLLVAPDGRADTSGHVTQLCGFSPPLPTGFTGTSPTGPGACEGVCSSGWTDGSCSDPPDGGSFLEIYGCTGATNGAPCDGGTNGGVMLDSSITNQGVSFSQLASDPSYSGYCTFQIDVRRPEAGAEVGLRDFIIWQRDDCSPPPVDPCYCPNGVDYQGNPITSFLCGEEVCGADFRTYACGANGWLFLGEVCPETPPCQCAGINDLGNPVVIACGESMCASDEQSYVCLDGALIPQGETCGGGGYNPWVDLSAGDYHSCGVHADGSIECWGANWAGELWPTVAGPFQKVSAGYMYTCGLLFDGDVVCWGDTYYGQAPSFVPGPFISLSTANDHACAVTESGDVECWGSLNGAPPPGTYVEVAAGSTHDCALRDDGAVICWGNDFSGESPPTGVFTQISAGHMMSCALRDDGDVECWGRNDWGQTNDQAGPFRQVSSNTFHACAARPDGSVSCWGDPTYGATNVPGGFFLQVSAGYKHTCALDITLTPVCWGNNSFGQLNVPN
jgi:hypothetical protein